MTSIVERKSGFTLIHKVERKTALAVSQAMIGLLKPHRKKVHTITSDNGKEFAGHEEIASKLKADFYFAQLLRIMGARNEREHEWIDTAVFPKEPGLHYDHTTGDRYGDGEIEQQTQKETWIPDI